MISFRQFICIWIFIITLLTFPLFAQEKLPAKLHENLRVVLHNTQPLKYPRGNRLSLYVWPITDRLRGLDDGQAEQAIKLLNDRGIAMISNWRYDQKEKTLTEALRIGALQKKLHLRVNVNATSCM